DVIGVEADCLCAISKSSLNIALSQQCSSAPRICLGNARTKANGRCIIHNRGVEIADSRTGERGHSAFPPAGMQNGPFLRSPFSGPSGKKREDEIGPSWRAV